MSNRKKGRDRYCRRGKHTPDELRREVTMPHPRGQSARRRRVRTDNRARQDIATSRILAAIRCHGDSSHVWGTDKEVVNFLVKYVHNDDKALGGAQSMRRCILKGMAHLKHNGILVPTRSKRRKQPGYALNLIETGQAA